jgi:two-component system NarL family sensor kinase
MPGFTIALWDSKAEVLIPGLIYLDGQRVATDGEWPFEPALLTIIAREHKTVLTDDYHATCRAYGIPGVSHVPPDERRSFLGVPMLISDRLVGVIVIATPNTTYAEEDRDLLVAIANQAGVAIENARLYQQTRELGVIEERNRLAREIHDTIAQGLTGIVLQLEAVDALLAARPERARQRLVTATELARNTLTEARRSVWNLRPKPLEERSLADSIAAETRRLADDGLVTRYAAQGDPGLVAPEVENAVYRIAQEALQNIRKHARATTVTVTLVWTAERLTLTIHDDGRGFEPEQLTQRRGDGGGFGLLGMRERARLIGGRLDIHSAPGAGTLLTIEAPLSGPAGIPRPTQPASPTARRALIP